ncbi:MAG: VOC family protein [Sphingomonas sp.]|nr:VOC family protein [Sphingomonas sp.]MDX3884233.1 VOC family protein [Sphingomonas sp.]
MSVHSLAYLVIGARDLAAWTSYAESVVGLMRGDSGQENVLHYRMDHRSFRFRIEAGEADKLIATGLECASRADWDKSLSSLQNAGVAVEVASAAEAKARGFHDLFRCVDPAGNPLEIGWGHIVSGTPFISPQAVDGFITLDGDNDMGFGHAVLPAPNIDETRAFYVDLLGFANSDEMRVYLQGGPDDPGIGMHFLHAGSPRHHVIGLAQFPNPSGLVHTMVEVATLDEVGIALDRALAAGTHISSTLGKHTNDKMVSFYMRTPGGFDIEYGCGGIRPDWSNFTPTFTIKEDLWGHVWDFGQ